MNPNLMQFFQNPQGGPAMLPPVGGGPNPGPAVGMNMDAPYLPPQGVGAYQEPYMGGAGAMTTPFDGMPNPQGDAMLASGGGPMQGGGVPLPVPRGAMPQGQGAPLPIPRGQAPGRGQPLPLPRDIGGQSRREMMPREPGQPQPDDEERKRALIEAVMRAAAARRSL